MHGHGKHRLLDSDKANHYSILPDLEDARLNLATRRIIEGINAKAMMDGKAIPVLDDVDERLNWLGRYSLADIAKLESKSLAQADRELKALHKAGETTKIHSLAEEWRVAHLPPAKRLGIK